MGLLIDPCPGLPPEVPHVFMLFMFDAMGRHAIGAFESDKAARQWLGKRSVTMAAREREFTIETWAILKETK